MSSGTYRLHLELGHSLVCAMIFQEHALHAMTCWHDMAVTLGPSLRADKCRATQGHRVSLLALLLQPRLCCENA